MGRNEILTRLADEVRRLSGATGPLGFEAMAEALKTIVKGGAGEIYTGVVELNSAATVSFVSNTSVGDNDVFIAVSLDGEIPRVDVSPSDGTESPFAAVCVYKNGSTSKTLTYYYEIRPRTNGQIRVSAFHYALDTETTTSGNNITFAPNLNGYPLDFVGEWQWFHIKR